MYESIICKGVIKQYNNTKRVQKSTTIPKEYKKSTTQAGKRVQREKKSFENGVEDLLQNAPSMYNKVLQELEYLKQNGADEKQMASLQKKADLLKTVVDNEEIINLAGKPIIKYLGKFISGIGR